MDDAPDLNAHFNEPSGSLRRPWLAGPDAKLERAIELIAAVRAGVDRWLETKPFFISAEFEAEEGCHIARFRVREGVPLRLSVLIGEYLHDLRSALDQTMWVIACQSNSLEALWEPKIARKISFPIVTSDRDSFRGHQALRFIDSHAAEIIDGFQPYHAGDAAKDESLALLNAYWNFDKHRVVNGGVGGLKVGEIKFRPGAIVFDELIKGVDYELIALEPPLVDGTPLYRIRFRGEHPPGTTTVRVNDNSKAQIFFGSGGTATDLAGFERMASGVSAVLEAFRPMMLGRSSAEASDSDPG